MDKTYEPKPVDTSAVEIPEEIRILSEYLAKNAHEIWALQRVKDGWTYGSVRDDTNKKHPDLIPYEDLPDGEKEYDRKTSMETIKLILSLGYTITKKD